MQVQFPSSFLWGAAISSYQCEGENYNSDWYFWEKEKGLEESGLACDHYNLFRDDFKIAKDLSLNSFRFSIEWSRICPGPDDFSQSQLEHYLAVIDSLQENSLRPVVTLHHFTNPSWFANKGGWLYSKNIDYFLAYLINTVKFLQGKVDTWLIFNEPLVYIYNSFIRGIWPPGGRSISEARRVLNNITQAYIIGYEEIKRIYKGKESSPQVSLAKNTRIFSGCPDFKFALNSLYAFARSKCFNFWLIDKLARRKCLDFIAINYYCREYTALKGLLGDECGHYSHGGRRNYLGWNVHPDGFLEILLAFGKYGLPIIITENGTAEKESVLYEDFLRRHLKALAQAFARGIDIKGYFWWSLLDNFEWDRGFDYRFGLVDVDYNNLKRSIKPFAYSYSKICRENKIDI